MWQDKTLLLWKSVSLSKVNWHKDAQVNGDIFLAFCCCHCAVAKSCPATCDPMDGSMPGLLVLHYLPKFAQTPIHCVDDAIQPSHSLVTLSPSSPPYSIFPCIRIFSHESAIPIRWLKYHGFSFSNIPSNEYAWLISIRKCKLDDWNKWPHYMAKNEDQMTGLISSSSWDSQKSSPAPWFQSIKRKQ